MNRAKQLTKRERKNLQLALRGPREVQATQQIVVIKSMGAAYPFMRPLEPLIAEAERELAKSS